jgi:rhamnosyltransferase
LQSVSIILPTRNNEDHIGALLYSIFSQNYDGEIEVLIMDSSDDRTPEIAEEFSRKHNVKVMRVEPEDYNYGGTRNLGASMTSGEIIIFLSTDVDIRDLDWLGKLIRNFGDPIVAGVYGGQLPKDDAPPMEEFFIKYTYPSVRKEYHLRPGEKLKGMFFSNTNSAIKREVWEKIPLPEMLKSEDQEWAKRALLAGYKVVYDPEAVVYHSHRYTLKQVFQEYFDSGATLPFVYSDERIGQKSFITRGSRYEYNEIKYFLKYGYGHWIPYALLYDFMKFLGYFLGSKHKYMPLWLKKALCKKKNHWDKYDDIIKF